MKTNSYKSQPIRSLELLSDIAMGNATVEDLANELRRQGIPFSDSTLRTKTPPNSNIVQRVPKIPFFLNGTMYDPKDITRFNGQELHLVPAPSDEHMLVVDNRELFKLWIKLAYNEMQYLKGAYRAQPHPAAFQHPGLTQYASQQGGHLGAGAYQPPSTVGVQPHPAAFQHPGLTRYLQPQQGGHLGAGAYQPPSTVGVQPHPAAFQHPGLTQYASQQGGHLGAGAYQPPSTVGVQPQFEIPGPGVSQPPGTADYQPQFSPASIYVEDWEKPHSAFFSHTNYQGSHLVLNGGRGFKDLRDQYIFFPFDSWNDEIQSLYVNKTWVILFEHINYGGQTLTLQQNAPDLGTFGWRDRTSSIASYRTS